MDLFGIIINALPLFAVFISLLVGIIYYINDKVKSKIGKESLYKLLGSHFEQNLISNKEDVRILLDSINRKYRCNYSLASTLGDYVVYISNAKESDNLKNHYLLIKEIILLENQELPFNNVPDEEKRILTNISGNIANNDLEAIKLNIRELSSVIAEKSKSHKKTQRDNKIYLPLAILGIILTIVFGIIGKI